jgi:hypothetical protein
LPESFDSNEVSKRGRVEGSEGVHLWNCYKISSWLRPVDGGRRPIHAKKQHVYALQAKLNQA